MDRRNFVATTATAIAACSIGVRANETTDGDIDAHVHVWPGPNAKYPLAKGFTESDRDPKTFTPEQLLSLCDRNSVKRVVLIQMNFFGFDNSYMLDCMRQYPKVFSGVAVIDENLPDATSTMAAFAEQGVRGFRLYADKKNAESWLSSPTMKKMWEKGAETRQAMCLLSNPDALPAIDAMCKELPKTTVVVDHFSRIGVTGKIDSDALDRLCGLARFPNVFVKTSAFYALGLKRAPYTDLGDMIKKLRDAYGANRLMWASDCPYQVEKGHTYEDSINLIRNKLDFLSEEDKSWMLRKTASQVFFS